MNLENLDPNTPFSTSTDLPRAAGAPQPDPVTVAFCDYTIERLNDCHSAAEREPIWQDFMEKVKSGLLKMPA